MQDEGMPGACKSAGSIIQPHLRLRDTVSIMIGIVIGAGIYETAPLIFQNVANVWQAFGVWIAGGVLTIIGGLCYAELASTYPRSGGDYVYLSKAYGSWAGFLFGWTQLAVLMTGSIGMMAYIFADYAVTLCRFGAASEFIFASGAVALLCIANLAGLAFGRGTQNTLTLLKFLALTALVFAGFLSPHVERAQSSGSASGGSLGLAMILVLDTYGGGNDAALVAAEVTDKARNIPRAFILGAALLIIVYLLVNAAYICALGFQGARQSKAIAAEVLKSSLGPFAGRAMAILVMVSALGALNGMLSTGSRIYAALGCDFQMFRRLAEWHPKRGVPAASLLAQTAIAILLIWFVGTQNGRACINAFLQSTGFGALEWSGHGGFETLLRCTAPIFWTFFLMSGVSLFILRVKDPSAVRPFRVPLYPLFPALFCAMCGYMLYSAAVYAGKLLVIGALPAVLGCILYWCGARRTARV